MYALYGRTKCLAHASLIDCKPILRRGHKIYFDFVFASECLRKIVKIRPVNGKALSLPNYKAIR